MQRLEARANLSIHIIRKDQILFADSLCKLTKQDYGRAFKEVSKTTKLSTNLTTNKLLSKVQSFSSHVQCSRVSLKLRVIQ